MKVKTSEASGPVLDWMVAKCEGYEIDADGCAVKDGVAEFNLDCFNPSEVWAQGGSIIGGGRICLDIGHDGVWLAYSKQNYDDEKEFMHSGPTPLIAAMRCYVASKLGDECEVPSDLL